VNDDLRPADLIVAVKKAEYRRLVVERFTASTGSIEFWRLDPRGRWLDGRCSRTTADRRFVPSYFDEANP
jgi:hypothetical protein